MQSNNASTPSTPSPVRTVSFGFKLTEDQIKANEDADNGLPVSLPVTVNEEGEIDYALPDVDPTQIVGDFTRLHMRPKLSVSYKGDKEIKTVVWERLGFKYRGIEISNGDETRVFMVPEREGRSRYVLRRDEDGKSEYKESFEAPIHIQALEDGRIIQGIFCGFKEAQGDVSRGAVVEIDGYESHLVCSEAIPVGCYHQDGNAIYRNESDAERDAQDSDGDRILVHQTLVTVAEAKMALAQLVKEGRPTDEIESLLHAIERYQRTPKGILKIAEDESTNEIVVDREGENVVVSRTVGASFKRLTDPEPTVVLGVGNKFPTTDQDPPMVRIPSLPKETFHPLPDLLPLFQAEAEDHAKQTTREGEQKAFFKTQRDNDTGLKTNELNVEGFLRMPRYADRKDRIRTLHVNPEDPIQRRRVIEWEGLKGLSKDGITASGVANKSEVTVLDFCHAWFFTPNRIGGQKPDALDWMLSQPIESVIPEVMNLEPKFRTVIPGKKKGKRAKIYDRGLLARLYKLGLVGFYELPKVREDIPATIVFWLKRPDVAYCGLTDTKRGNQLRTFCYVLPPVAQFTDKGWQIVSAKQALANRLAEFNCEIRHPRSHELLKNFPESLPDMARYSGKRAALQKFIQEICGVYGDSVPATLVKGKLVPTNESSFIARNTVVIDYGPDAEAGKMTLDQKWNIALEVNEITRICLSAGKGGSRRVRKFPLAQPNGVPTWAPENCHPRRAGNMRAQAQMARRARKYCVAVVKMDTRSVPLITPTGVEKQRIQADENVFLPRVSSVPAEGYTKEETTITWGGEAVMNWISTARDCCEVGKMVNPWGMKFVPRASGVRQAVAHIPEGTSIDGNPCWEAMAKVDIVMPIDELAAKGCIRRALKGARPALVTMGDQQFEALIVEIAFHRSGAASENIKPRRLKRRVRGADRLCVQAQLMRIYPNMGMAWPDLRYAIALQRSMMEIADFVGLGAATEESSDYDSD